MKLFAAGVSHKTAPVERREQLAVKQSEIVDLAFVLKCFGHLDEVVLLSTCNRVEIYGTTRQATGHIRCYSRVAPSRAIWINYENELGEAAPSPEDYDDCICARHFSSPSVIMWL
jgi:glutamyl-tRNA reductase